LRTRRSPRFPDRDSGVPCDERKSKSGDKSHALQRIRPLRSSPDLLMGALPLTHSRLTPKRRKPATARTPFCFGTATPEFVARGAENRKSTSRERPGTNSREPTFRNQRPAFPVLLVAKPAAENARHEGARVLPVPFGQGLTIIECRPCLCWPQITRRDLAFSTQLLVRQDVAVRTRANCQSLSSHQRTAESCIAPGECCFP
jgi:hypothetical protein